MVEFARSPRLLPNMARNGVTLGTIGPSSAPTGLLAALIGSIVRCFPLC
jgi:hypothetical protein